jgi:hypothetical protein
LLRIVKELDATGFEKGGEGSVVHMPLSVSIGIAHLVEGLERKIVKDWALFAC